MSQLEAGWCVVMSKPMAESVAEQAIRGRGYRVYLPMTSKMIRGTAYDEFGRKTRPRGEIVLRPAFRGYLFFELWPNQPWRDLIDSRLTHGVAGVILRGDRPVMLSPTVIDALRDHEAAGEFDEPKGLRCRGSKTSKRRTDLSDGDAVRIGEGPFAGFLGELAGQDDQGRAEVLLRMMGRDVPVHTEGRLLEVVDH